MRILICDDDELVSSQLVKILETYFEKNNLLEPDIVTYTNGEALLNDSAEKDIVFLDIEMPGASGILVGNKLKKKNADTIILIVTSYIEYLDDAMRFNVFRYITKPLEPQRIFRNLKEALTQYYSINKKVSIETEEGTFMVNTSEIVLVESLSRKVLIHTPKKDYISLKNLKYWSDSLDLPCFFSPHKSFIINFNYVTDFNHTLINLCNGQFSAYLTRRKYSEFKKIYLLYLEGKN